MRFISEALKPIGGFDTQAMAQGEPGLPEKFRWRARTFRIAEILESWKEYGDCKHGSGERYLRRHCHRLRTVDGVILKVYFQRSFGRGTKTASRWWLQSLEEKAEGLGRKEISPKVAA